MGWLLFISRNALVNCFNLRVFSLDMSGFVPLVRQDSPWSGSAEEAQRVLLPPHTGLGVELRPPAGTLVKCH